jgi:putative spermidine/putrescine transport system ATP-binding protein
LAPGFVDGANNLSGKVDAVTYLGSIVRIRLDIANQPVSLDVFNEKKLRIPSVGEEYQISFPIDSCWLI